MFQLRTKIHIEIIKGDRPVVILSPYPREVHIQHICSAPWSTYAALFQHFGSMHINAAKVLQCRWQHVCSTRGAQLQHISFM